MLPTCPTWASRANRGAGAPVSDGDAWPLLGKAEIWHFPEGPLLPGLGTPAPQHHRHAADAKGLGAGPAGMQHRDGHQARAWAQLQEHYTQTPVTIPLGNRKILGKKKKKTRIRHFALQTCKRGERERVVFRRHKSMGRDENISVEIPGL